MASFWLELKRRNVFRVGLAYLAAAWLVLQVADMVLEAFAAPAWILQALIFSAVVGAPLALVLAWLYELTPEGLKAESDIGAAPEARITGRKLDFAIIGLLVLAVGVLLAANFLPDGPSDGISGGNYASSIAALPFSNESAATENAEFFANGIHDELLTRLANIGALKVVSRTSVEEYRDTTKNLREIGQELGVATILEGRVQRAGDMVRINVQLIDAETDEHLWAELYHRELTAENIFAIQSDIATSIAQALNSALTPREAARLANVPTQSTRAYEFYLSGNEYRRRIDPDDAAVPLTVQQYERAVEEDPGFALAWAALGRAHMRMYLTGLDHSDARRQRSLDSIQRAFQLSPGLPEAHLALGYYHMSGFGDTERALREWAIAEPDMTGDAELYRARAVAYRRTGDWGPAVANLARAIELDPRNLSFLRTQVISYEILRDYTRADAMLDRILEIAPDDRFAIRRKPIVHVRRGDMTSVAAARRFQATETEPDPWWVWWAALYQQDYDTALSAIHDWDVDDDYKAWFYGMGYRLAGQPEAAVPYLETAREAAERELEAEAGLGAPRAQARLAQVLGLLGETEAAIALAREALDALPTAENAVLGPHVHLEAIDAFVAAGAYDTALAELDAYLAAPGHMSVEGAATSPALRPIRDDARFQALVERYGRR